MSDDERHDLSSQIRALIKELGELKGKLDVALVLLNQYETWTKTCREHCEANKRETWDAINQLRQPRSWHDVGIIILAVIGIVNLLMAFRGVGH